MEVSLIVPVYNECENLRRFHEEASPVLQGLDKSYEIIYVDDGSTDGSTAILQAMAKEDPRVRVVEFRRNFGQTAAMNAGIHLASGDVVVTIDADLQNDPADILVKLQWVLDNQPKARKIVDNAHERLRWLCGPEYLWACNEVLRRVTGGL